jgi:tRNA(Ile)-lysidine synthase
MLQQRCSIFIFGMMDVQTRFIQYWQQHFAGRYTGKTLLLAVSGGVDSVVLAHLLHTTGLPFVMAHCNFRLRAEESERDEVFVHRLAALYGKTLLVRQFDTAAYAGEHKISIQEAARELRYSWFRALLEGEQWPGEAGSPVPLAAIATAHHANDNIETLLINFFRGTGISGLHGILPVQGRVIRPLLFAGKEDILQYAADHALGWVEDSSNSSEKYTRNFFRRRIIPAVQEVFPQAEQNLLQNIERFRDIELLYRQAVQAHTRKLLEQKGDEVHIPVLKLQQVQPLPTVLWEIIKPYGFHTGQVNEVLKLLDAVSGSYVSSATHQVIRNRNWLIIAPLQTTTAQHILIEKHNSRVAFAGGTLQLENIPARAISISHQASVACLDAAAIQYPLLLRRWQQGDYFYPLGMRKKKKLSRFLIDLKLSKTDKEKVWVLEMNRKIIWVIGYRIDDRFKITPASPTMLKIVFTATE